MTFRTVYSSQLTDKEIRNIFLQNRYGSKASCRNGSVYLELITECTKQELEPVITRKIKKETEVFSDTLTSYNGLMGLGYVHEPVNHGMEIYVNGRVHINGMEGFWGLSKTNMHTYKGIKKKNWILYLKEMEFRYNNRNINFSDIVDKLIAILMDSLNKPRAEF